MTDTESEYEPGSTKTSISLEHAQEDDYCEIRDICSDQPRQGLFFTSKQTFGDLRKIYKRVRGYDADFRIHACLTSNNTVHGWHKSFEFSGEDEQIMNIPLSQVYTRNAKVTLNQNLFREVDLEYFVKGVGLVWDHDFELRLVLPTTREQHTLWPTVKGKTVCLSPQEVTVIDVGQTRANTSSKHDSMHVQKTKLYVQTTDKARSPLNVDWMSHVQLTRVTPISLGQTKNFMSGECETKKEGGTFTVIPNTIYRITLGHKGMTVTYEDKPVTFHKSLVHYFMITQTLSDKQWQKFGRCVMCRQADTSLVTRYMHCIFCCQLFHLSCVKNYVNTDNSVCPTCYQSWVLQE